MSHTLFPSHEAVTPPDVGPILNPKDSLGFTGTRQGLTQTQRAALLRSLRKTLDVTASGLHQTVHHGLCVGADEEFHFLIRSLFFKVIIVGHPGAVPERLRSSAPVDELRAVKPPIERNHDIVNETRFLLACPFGDHEILHSGTWSTIRYAHRMGRPYTIILPDGSLCSNYKNLSQR